MAASTPRFLGLDVHKQSIVVSAVDSQQQVLLPARRVSLAEFESWATSHLLATDAVVLEASTNAWEFYDLLEPLVASVTVAHPFLIKLLAQVRVKTDGRDPLHLAKLRASNLIPAVWVPPKPVRELRAILAHRHRLIAQRTQVRKRLHSMLHRHNLPPPEGDPFTAEQRAWWVGLPLSPLEQLQVRQDLALLEHLAPLIKEVEETLAHLSTDDPWAKPMALLLQLPGVGLVTALTTLAAIGDIGRFPSAKKTGRLQRPGRQCLGHWTNLSDWWQNLRKDDGICGRCWLKRPGLRWSITPSGRRFLSAWPPGRAKRKRLLPLPANSWW